MALLTRILSKGRIQGSVSVPRSGSLLHRYLICAALAGGRSGLERIDVPGDVQVTRNCLGTLGLGQKNAATGNFIYRLECRESDSTYKFLMPIASACSKDCIYSLRGNLRFVSMDQFYKVLRTHGLKREEISPDLVKVTGRLTAGTYIFPGVSDGQALSGLLMALPLLKEKCTVMLEKKPQSEPYVDMTIAIMRMFGIQIEEMRDQNGLDRVIKIPGGQSYESVQIDPHIEGDWTLAAYWLAGAAMCGGSVTCTNLDVNSLQGDRRIINILQLFGAEVDVKPHKTADRIDRDEEVYWADVTVTGGHLKGINVDAQDIADLLVPVVLMASAAEGVSIIKNAESLRNSSELVKSIVDVMSQLGAQITEVQDGLLIAGNAGKEFSGGRIISRRDYRIVMMTALTSCLAGQDMIIENADTVNRVYPEFFNEIEKMKNNCR